MIPLPVYTEAALLTLEAGRTPVFPEPWTGPLEDADIYDQLQWEGFQEDFPELFDQDCAS